MPVKQILEGGQVPVHIWTEDVDSATKQQLLNVAQLPIVHRHVAAMPDVHLGKGATVGSVIATKGAIIPAACGVDIGCGMIAARTTLRAEDLDEPTLRKVFGQIQRDVPVGFEQHSDARRHVDEALPLEPGLTRITENHPGVLKRVGKRAHWVNQLGTLGGGNHFIEVCVDEEGRIWVMLHSGSRGIGNAIGMHFIELARRDMERLQVQLPDRDLAYLTEGTEHFDDYVEAVGWAQDYARRNRQVMMDLVIAALKRHTKPFEVVSEAVNCHHNYVTRERHFGEDVWVTRKGAIRSAKGDLGIVPGCFAAGTRVLMATGLYKDIESIVPGERVIAGDGSTTTVVNTFRHGTKEVWAYRNNAFHEETMATPGHPHFVGNLSSANIQAEGRVKVIDRPTRNGQSKYQWRPLSDLSRSKFTFLMPRTISFDDMPSSFRLESEGLVFEPSYSMGYLFGTFLGDGTCRYKNGDGGQVSWSFGLGESAVAARLIQALDGALDIKAKLYESDKCLLVVVHNARLARFFAAFGKKASKAIPKELWCSHREYATGLADGLIDSDGHWGAKTPKLTNTSQELIEQYGVIHYLLRGYFPSVTVRAPSTGGLRGCNEAHCKPSYRATSLRLPPIASKHQLVELLHIDKSARSADVYDIEVAHHEHGFIANNTIVHNSMGAQSFIVRGKGNPESFESSAHGAGRRLSRNAAKKQFSEKDLAAQTQGVVCRKDRGVVDEIPAAYKPVAEVMANQSDLVEVVHTLRQLVCVKG